MMDDDTQIVFSEDMETEQNNYSFSDLFEPEFPENRNLLPGNEAIMASAGTGKTFSLAMRYISLLHAGVAPGRILASTFTKKAAGEIYDKIAEELICLASSEKKAAELVKNFPVLANGRFDSARAGGILGRLLKSKDRLQISTLDSFFVNIIRAFPLECGIFGELSIMEESDSRSRVNTLLSLLKELRQEDRKEIMETVKEASFGENKKYLYGTVKELVFDLYDKFLICPDAKYWCSEKLRELIPGSYFSNKEKLQKIADTYPGHLENFLSDHKKNKNTENLYEIFTGILADALKAEDNPKADKKTLAIWEKFSAVYPTFPITEPGMDSITISYNKEKYLLQGKFYQHTVILMRQILFCNIRSLIKRNEALWRILDLFNRKYALLVRSAGKIAFSDIPYLLRPDENNAETGLALPFSDRAGIEERLDEKTDHYLIDEFQDTSDSQWNAISRLAEEAITDSDGGRSFFYVGDIKQSIYQWRYGNPGLFDMILKKFPESTYGERGIRKNTLIKSYRSSNEVLNMVNVVFMNPAAVLNIKNAEADEKKIIYNALTKLQYEQHISAPSAAKQKGFSCYFQLPPVKKGETKAAQENKFRKIYDLLTEIDPFNDEKHSFSVGVLFRTNNTASEFAECIRQFSMEDILAGKKVSLPVSLDSRLSVKESQYCVLAYHILLGTAHPGNQFVRQMFEMLEQGRKKLDQNSLAELLGYTSAEKLSGEEILYNGVRADLANGGFELFFTRFTEAYRANLSSFDERRLKSLIDAARKYDLQGMDDIDTFLEIAYEEAGNEISLRNTVQCMTYHKSKGLAFDIVIMPDINGDSMSSTTLHKGVFLSKSEDFSPDFLTTFPSKQFLKSVPVLDEFAGRLKNDAAYENCCMLYVGMTRAKHALYLYGNEKGPSAKTINMATLCSAVFEKQETEKSIIAPDLQILWENGNEKWYEEERKLALQKKRKEKEEEKKTDELVKRNKQLTEKCFNKYLNSCEEASSEGKSLIRFPEKAGLSNAPKPSMHLDKSVKISQTKSFSLSSTAADLGTKVHELFCQIDFYDGSAPEEYLQKIFSMDVLKTEEGKLLAKAWADPAIRNALKHPGTPSASLRKERSFLLPDQAAGNYISGIFDRLVAEYDENGTCTGATVIDYKSDKADEETLFLERYSQQLNIYRKAAASLLNIPQEKVKCKLLALRCGKVITVPMT